MYSLFFSDAVLLASCATNSNFTADLGVRGTPLTRARLPTKEMSLAGSGPSPGCVVFNWNVHFVAGMMGEFIKLTFLAVEITLDADLSSRGISLFVTDVVPKIAPFASRDPRVVIAIFRAAALWLEESSFVADAVCVIWKLFTVGGSFSENTVPEGKSPFVIGFSVASALLGEGIFFAGDTVPRQGSPLPRDPVYGGKASLVGAGVSGEGTAAEMHVLLLGSAVWGKLFSFTDAAGERIVFFVRAVLRLYPFTKCAIGGL